MMFHNVSHPTASTCGARMTIPSPTKQFTGLFCFTVRAFGVRFSSIKNPAHIRVQEFLVEMRRIELLSENTPQDFLRV